MQRKPCLAEAGRVLVSSPVCLLSAALLSQSSASLCSGQHPEFRSAAYLGEETFEVYGTRSGLCCSEENANRCELQLEVLSPLVGIAFECF